jgi:hypothetical protein
LVGIRKERQMFHKHKWKIIETYKFGNELEKFIGTGTSLNCFTTKELAKRGVITVLQCEKCTTVRHEKTVFE